MDDQFPIKVELHVHLDGAVRAETIWDLSRRRRITWDNVNTLEKLKEKICTKEPCSLTKILESFDYIIPAIRNDRDALFRIAYEFCEDAANQNIRYVEVRYSPHEFLDSASNGQPTLTSRDIVRTINEAIEKGSVDFGIKVYSILCCIRDQPENFMEVVSLCHEFRASGVVGIDVAGPEFLSAKDATQCQLKQAFKEAHRIGLHITAHAGEDGPAEMVREAIKELHAERIGHGYHVTDDVELYADVIRRRIHFETCPISAIRTKATSGVLAEHILFQFAHDGVNFSINTDDPVVLENTISDDYKLAQDGGMTRDQIIKTIFNAARSSFAPETVKDELLQELVTVYGDTY